MKITIQIWRLQAQFGGIGNIERLTQLLKAMLQNEFHLEQFW